eukprot:3669506-Amphidinium_carterae.1
MLPSSAIDRGPELALVTLLPLAKLSPNSNTADGPELARLLLPNSEGRMLRSSAIDTGPELALVTLLALAKLSSNSNTVD